MQAYADMLVASTSSLTIGRIYMGRRQLNTLLSLLARTGPCSSPFRSFHMRQPIECPGTAALLHDALCHHTSLSSLSLEKVSCSHQGGTSPALAVLPALPHLPRLTSLDLSLLTADPSATEATASTAATLEALAAAVTALPHLGTFAIAVEYMHPEYSRNNTRKRQRIDTATSKNATPSLDPVIAALSSRPALTRLGIKFESRKQPTITCSGICGPFPALQDLDISMDAGYGDGDWGIAGGRTFHPLPLSSVSALTTLSICFGVDDLERRCTKAVIDAAAQQPALRALILSVQSIAESSLLQLEASLGALEQLRSLRVELGDSCEFSPHGLRALVNGISHVPKLTCLDFYLEQMFLERSEDGQAGEPSSNQMFAPLRRLTQLQTLCYDYACKIDDPHPLWQVNDAFVADALQERQLLTSLSLCFRVEEVSLHMIVPRVSVLTRLQSLVVHGLIYEGVHHVRECLSPLTGLASLDLSLRPFDAALVRCVGECAAGMPGLMSCSLRSGDLNPDNDYESEYAARDWLQGLLHLPSHGAYTFAVENEAIPAFEYEAMQEELERRGAKVYDSCQRISFLSQ